MLKQAAFSFFGGRAGVLEILGNDRTYSAVYQWGDVVPLAAARRLEAASAGRLKADMAMYDEFGHIRRPKKRKRAA